MIFPRCEEMIGGPFVTYSEVAGAKPTEADIETQLRPLDVRKLLFLLSQMNMHFRLARSAEGISYEQAIGNAQVFLFRFFTDEDLFERIKASLGHTNAHERVLFHPLQILNVMCCALKYCQGHDEAEVTDEQRYILGRSCLVMNDLLAKEEENQRLVRGSDNTRKAELMSQFLPGFEVNNPGDVVSLLNRSLGMFNLLMSDSETRAKILRRTGNYDFPQRFLDLTGVALDRWIAILFCFIAYFNQNGGTDGTGRDYRNLWIDPGVWIGTSEISENDLRIVLELIAKDVQALASAFEAQPADMRSTNTAPFKFYPLIKIDSRYICSDYGFLVEKMFSGAYWAIHNREDDKGRDRLSSAWGILFERYVNWWAQNRSFQRPMTYYPFPVWDSCFKRKCKTCNPSGKEAFDAAILQEGRFMALEYKGGFLKLDAKYSMNLRNLLRELHKKISKGCRQLARNIGELFGIVPAHQLENISTDHITRVIPVIVVQDQALRSLGIDWWLRRQFRREMRREVLRPEITIEPVTLIHIDEFETMIDSAEGPDFGFFETIQLRNLRDSEGLSDLNDILLKSKGYGTQHSTRRKELETDFENCVLKYAFPNEFKSKE
jgi:hypothetical protein